MSNAAASHKAAVTKEIASMPGRKEIEARMAAETNTTVKIWIWQYLQTL